MLNSYSKWWNFQSALKNHYGFFFLHLHTLPSTIAFRLEYVLFYKFYAKTTTFFVQEKFGMAPLLYIEVKAFGGNWRENDVKMSNILTSWMRVVLHLLCKTTFPCLCRVHGMQEHGIWSGFTLFAVNSEFTVTYHETKINQTSFKLEMESFNLLGYRGSYMSAFFIIKFIKRVGRKEKKLGFAVHLIVFPHRIFLIQ